jgi:hypothetical protein
MRRHIERMRTLRIRLVARQARRPLFSGAFAAIIAAAIVGLGASPANADHNDPVAICGGSEYNNTGAAVSILDANLQLIGYLEIRRHVNSDTFCAVTIRKFHNQTKFTAARIKQCAPNRHPGDPCNGDAGWKSDAGQFMNYAGPVYRSKGGGTIVAEGQIGAHCSKIWFRGSGDADVIPNAC